LKPKLRIVKAGEDTGEPTVTSRDCYLLEADRLTKPTDRFISKFGGLPYLQDQSWPVCKACKKPLSFVMQLRTDDAKGFLKGFPKMFSLFYCFSCRPWWDVDGKGFLARISAIDGNAKMLPAKNVPLEIYNEVKPIAIKLTISEDYPTLQDVSYWDQYDLNVKEMLSQRYPNHGQSKLSGYASWVTKPDIPKCRHCGAKMNFLGQITSGEFHGVEWPDMGKMLIFSCEKSCREDAISIVIQGE